MQPLDVLTGLAAPYPRANADTDTIIRIERCTRTPREQMGQYAFEMERFAADGTDNAAFVLNQPRYRGAKILVAGANFGCGSSREMAVWAIAGLGIRCVIAPSFGEIFYNNCFQNGVLAIVLPADAVSTLIAHLADQTHEPVLTVDLVQQRIECAGGAPRIEFAIDPLRREALLHGLDAIELTLKMVDRIDAFEARDSQARPWIYATGAAHR